MNRPTTIGNSHRLWARVNSGRDTHHDNPSLTTPLPYDLGRLPSDKALEWQPHHVAAIAKALSKNRAALDMSDMGTGKTYCTAFLSDVFQRPLGIVCPKRLIFMWNSVCSEVSSIPPLFVNNYESLRLGKSPFVVKKGSTFVWQVPENILLVFDEVHWCRGRDTLNSKLLMAAKKQGIPLIMLSATPAITPLDMKAIGYALGLHNKLDFWQWAQKNGCRPNVHFGGFSFPEGKDGENIMKKIHADIMDGKGARMNKALLGDVFPECHIVAELYQLPEKGQEEFEVIYKEFLQRLDDLKEQAELPITELLRIRQKLELLKVPLLASMTKDLLDEGQSVIIFLSFTESIDILAKELGEDGILYGGTNKDDQQRFLDEFQADKRRVLIINSADPEGLSLHDKHGKYPRVALISPTYHALKLRQIFGRLQRAGVKTESLFKIIYAAKTCEEKACYSVRQKLRNVDSLTDGDLQTGLPFEIQFDNTDKPHKL